METGEWFSTLNQSALERVKYRDAPRMKELRASQLHLQTENGTDSVG